MKEEISGAIDVNLHIISNLLYRVTQLAYSLKPCINPLYGITNYGITNSLGIEFTHCTTLSSLVLGIPSSILKDTIFKSEIYRTALMAVLIDSRQ